MTEDVAPESPAVAVLRLPHGEGLPLPGYQTAGSAGMDLCAANSEPVTLEPGERALLPTGLKIALPPGFEAQIRPRSGLALKQGVTVLNAPGTIDCDYRGEVQVLLINLGAKPIEVLRGDRIAQMVIAPYSRAAWREVKGDLPATQRADGGFGSTGRSLAP